MKPWRLWLLGFLLCTGAGPGQVVPTLTGRILLGFAGRTPVPEVQVTLGGGAEPDAH